MEAISPREQRIRKVVANRQAGLVVVLEDIHDPHNAAAIFRTADALGIQDIHLVFAEETPWNPRTIGKSSSSSANKWLDFTVHDATADALNALRSGGYHQVGTALSTNAVSLFDAGLAQDKVAIWVGNEHRGLSSEAVNGVDAVVQIPMRGFVQSLNVSVSAAMILFEVARQRHVAGDQWQLDQEDQERLVTDFLER